MVYCSKCGTQNEDTAEYCAKCGANLQTGTQASGMFKRKKAEQECFGLPHGGAIFGLAIGVIVLVWGISTLAETMGWVNQLPENLWFIVLIIFGVLLIAGAIYGITRKKSPEIPRH